MRAPCAARVGLSPHSVCFYPRSRTAALLHAPAAGCQRFEHERRTASVRRAPGGPQPHPAAMAYCKQQHGITPEEVRAAGGCRRLPPTGTFASGPCAAVGFSAAVRPCPSCQMYFNAKDELITIVPNFSLPTENATATCISVRGCCCPCRPPCCCHFGACVEASAGCAISTTASAHAS